MRNLSKYFHLFIIIILITVPISSIIVKAEFGDVIEIYDCPVGSSGLSWDGTFIWVTDSAKNKIYKVEPSNCEIIKSYDSPFPNPVGIEWGGTFLWIIGRLNEKNQLFKLNPTNFNIIQLCPSLGDLVFLAWDGHYLWCQSGCDRTDKYDPSTGMRISYFNIPWFKSGIAWDGIYLWQVDHVKGIINAIDTNKQSIQTSYQSSIFENAKGICFDGTYLWIIGLIDGYIKICKLDYMNISIGSIEGGFGLKIPVYNKGITTLANLTWSINIDGGYWLNKRNLNGVIQRLLPEESNLIKASGFFGLGEVNINVKVGDTTESIPGFVVGPIILI